MHVVIVAYGQRAATRRAVGRARSWGDLVTRISVVPAGPVSDVAPGTFDNVSVPRQYGSAGIREIAAGDRVLVLHDDVVIDRTAAARLIDALDEADYAVARDDDGIPRPSCLAARSLSALTSSLVLPRAQLPRDIVGVALLDIAAPHEETCRSELLDDHMDPDEPLLVASMIVKDEEQRLPDALASIVGLVDRIDICDTGSRDATIDIIRRAGGRVKEIPWRSDFAWARNMALDMCADAPFALMFDADERIVLPDPRSFRRWLRTWGHEVDAVSVRVDNERGDDVASSVYSTRICRPAFSRFDGAVHEILTTTQPDGRTKGRTVRHTDLAVTHIGYRSDIVVERDKHQRNIDIARTAHDSDPSPKTAIDLARSLLAADGDSQEAVALFESVAEDLGASTPTATRSYVLASCAQHASRNGDHERAAELAGEALSLTPNEDIALAIAAVALLSLGRETELVDLSVDLAARPPGAPLFTVPRNALRYRALVGVALVRTGQVLAGIEAIADVMAEDAPGVAEVIAPAVPEIIERAADPSVVTALVAHDVTGHITAALAASVRPTQTASIALAGIMMGEPHAAVVTLQLTAALVAAADDLADAGMAFADTLEAPARRKLADLAARKNRFDLADRLAGSAPSMIGEQP